MDRGLDLDDGEEDHIFVIIEKTCMGAGIILCLNLEIGGAWDQ